MTEQPQEYIITMARIIKARNMLMADGYHNADVLDRMVNLLRSRPTPPADALDHSSCAVENCSVRYRAGGSQSNGEWVCSEADHTPIKKLKVCPAWLKAHDAAIRNETLDEIMKFPPDTMQATEGEGDLYAWNIKTLQSLRREGAQ